MPTNGHGRSPGTSGGATGRRPRFVHVEALDHVAIRVAERPAVAAFLTERCGLREIDRTDRLTLLGGDARRGKVTLLDAAESTAPGALERIVLRVPRLSDLLADLSIDRHVDANEELLLPEPTVPLSLVEREGCGVVDLDHIVLRVIDPERTGRELERLGFDRTGDDLSVGDRLVRLVGDDSDYREPQLLDHLGLLVGSATETQSALERLRVPIREVVDAPNTLAVFAEGPAGLTLEYVEHKPGFALV